MFVRYYLELPLPAGQVEQALVQAPAGWLAAIARVAEATLKDLLDQLGHAIGLSQPDPAGRIGP